MPDTLTYTEAILAYCTTHQLTPEQSIHIYRCLTQYAETGGYPDGYDILNKELDGQTMLDKVDRDIQLMGLLVR